MSNSFSHLIWLGAGQVQDPSNLIEKAKRAVLVDARESACNYLSRQFPSDKVSVIQQLLTAGGGQQNFTEYNLREYSAIQSAEGLKSIFPGLKVISQETKDSISIKQFLKGVALTDNNNLLVVDLPDINLPFLKALIESDDFYKFSKIYVFANPEPLYIGSINAQGIEAFFQSVGYLLEDTLKTDPDFPCLIFGLNPLFLELQQANNLNSKLANEVKVLSSHHETLKHQLAESKQQSDAITKEKESFKQQLASQQQQKESQDKERETLKQQLVELKQQTDLVVKERESLKLQITTVTQQLTSNQQVLATTKQQLDVTNKAKQEAEQQLSTVKQQLTTAQQELVQTKTQQQVENSLQQLFEQTLQKMFADQAQQLTKEVGNIKNHINTGLGNTAKQLEAFIGIQNYLERGVKPLSFHGWPISPDIGLYIAGLIDANNYDVIIEFGSGTSTVLMAKALISKQRGVQTKALANTSQSNEVAVQDQTFTDLPARIVTFEHNSLYHGKTTQALKDNGVGHLVDLVHAPLVDYQYKDGSQYLYYNCSEKLQELAKIFKGRKANILVLVDGPPGATNKNARFPALPHLVNLLPEHSFTIIMDDYNRTEEKEIVDIWEKISEERYMDINIEEMKCEKGCATIFINCKG